MYGRGRTHHAGKAAAAAAEEEAVNDTEGFILREIVSFAL